MEQVRGGVRHADQRNNGGIGAHGTIGIHRPMLTEIRGSPGRRRDLCRRKPPAARLFLNQLYGAPKPGTTFRHSTAQTAT